MATLSQLLDLPDLGLTLIKSGPGDPEITWASTTELLDLSPYLEGGEILLTTGLTLSYEDPRWRDFVASLSRARVAAIGFGVGVNHERVPPPLVQAASMYRVALFEIPLPVPFIAVTKAIAALIRADELRATRHALHAQQQLLDSAWGDQDPAEVLAVIAQATGKQLALVGTDDAVHASTAGFSTRDGVEYAALDPGGTLRLAVAGAAPLSPEGRAIISAGAMVLGIGLHGDRADQQRERDRWEECTRALIAGTLPPGVLTVLAPSLRLPERVRALSFRGSADDITAWRSHPRSGFDRLVALADPAPSGLRDAWQICPDSEGTLDRALESARHHGLSVVVGRAESVDRCSMSARSALAKRAALGMVDERSPLIGAPSQPVVWADRDTPVLETIIAAGEPTGAAIVSAVLGPLARDRDGARSSTPAPEPLTSSDRDELRRTLQVVFESDGHRGPAATALGIHRNTLRDRINRIEALTGRTLASADDRAELWFALRLDSTEDASTSAG